MGSYILKKNNIPIYKNQLSEKKCHGSNTILTISQLIKINSYKAICSHDRNLQLSHERKHGINVRQ